MLLIFCFLPVGLAQKTSLVRDGEIPERLCGGFQWSEGPVFHPDGFLLFTDMPRNTIMKFERGKLSVFRKKMAQPNGLALDEHGRLHVCQHGKGRLIRISKRGRVSVLARKFKGKRLSHPNDLVIRSDGGIYFTDHGFSPDKEKEEGRFPDMAGVYYLPSEGALKCVSTDFIKPNGLALSPDERRLYVNDTERSEIRVFEVSPDGSLSDGNVFAVMHGDRGVADGMETDDGGNIYSAGPGGIWVFDPKGILIEKIAFPEQVSNLAWGDDGRSLYVTTGQSLYRLKMNTGKRLR